MYDPTGINTSSESPSPFLNGPSAPGEESALSSWQVEELLLQATTALQRVALAASKVHAREVLLAEFSPALHMTPAPAPVSPFMQRLMLYCGLLGQTVMELSSIAQMNPVTAATGSLKEQASPESSPPRKTPLSPSDLYDLPQLDWDEEPPVGSVVLDDTKDVWQRDCDGWTCAVGDGGGFHAWTWKRLRGLYTLRLLIKGD